MVQYLLWLTNLATVATLDSPVGVIKHHPFTCHGRQHGVIFLLCVGTFSDMVSFPHGV